MLVQHLLTERLFRTIFNNPEFVKPSAIAAKAERCKRSHRWKSRRPCPEPSEGAGARVLCSSLCEPSRISADINHGYSRGTLEFRNQFENRRPWKEDLRYGCRKPDPDGKVAFSGGHLYAIRRSRIEKRNLSLGRSLHNRRCGLKLEKGVFSIVLFSLLTTTALAQTRGGALTLRFTSLSPIVSLAAGILILVFPKLLRFIVGFYLIVVGLMGLLGR